MDKHGAYPDGPTCNLNKLAISAGPRQNPAPITSTVLVLVGSQCQITAWGTHLGTLGASRKAPPPPPGGAAAAWRGASLAGWAARGPVPRDGEAEAADVAADVAGEACRGSAPVGTGFRGVIKTVLKIISFVTSITSWPAYLCASCSHYFKRGC